MGIRRAWSGIPPLKCIARVRDTGILSVYDAAPARKTPVVLKNLLKIGGAAALVCWMAYSGRLDLGTVIRATSQWTLIAGIAALFYLQIFVLSLRWRVLARALDFDLSRKDAFSLTMIGMFFNTALPGSVGGDVLKAYYAARAGAGRAGPIASIVGDRIIGLFSLTLVAVMGAAFSMSELAGHPELRSFWFLLTGLLAASGAVGMAAIVASEHLISLAGRARIHSGLRVFLTKVLAVLAEYNHRRAALFQALALSIPCHLLACVMFYFCLDDMSQNSLNPHLLLLIVPLGLVATALPLAPGGIGVGQAAFYTLFELVLRGQGSRGAGAFTVYQLVLLLVSLSGGIFYLRYKTPTDRIAVTAVGASKT